MNPRVQGALLAIIVLLIFGQSMHFPFSSWDDQRFIAQNALLAEASATHAVDCLRTNSVAGERLYIPVTYLSFLAERAVFDLRPGASHAINLLLHLCNVLLLFCGLRKLGLLSGAFVGALLFAIHPLQVEAVAWAMGRKDLLSTSFALIALLLYHRQCRQPHRLLRALAFASFAAAILAKPAMITFPGLLFLLDWQARGRLGFRDLLGKFPEAIVCLLILYVHLTLPGTAESAAPPLVDRVIAIPGVLSDWAMRFALLEAVNPFYTWRDSGAWRSLVTGGMLIVILLTLIGVTLRSSQRWLAGGLSFLVIAGAPALGVILQYRIFITGDRYGYFPLIGIYFLIATFAETGRVSRGIALAFALVSGVFAWSAVQVWASDIGIWRAAIHYDDQNVTAHNNLALAYVHAGESDVGLAQFQAGLRVEPTHTGLLSNMGRLLLDRGEPQAAVPVLQAVLRQQPNSFRTLKNLAEAFEQLGHLGPAEGALRQAIVAWPGYIDAHITLGRVLHKASKHEQALAALRHAATMASNRPEIWTLLAEVYTALENPRAAEEARQRAQNP
jgi:protein O-mannosyl-transferase